MESNLTLNVGGTESWAFKSRELLWVTWAKVWSMTWDVTITGVKVWILCENCPIPPWVAFKSPEKGSEDWNILSPVSADVWPSLVLCCAVGMWFGFLVSWFLLCVFQALKTTVNWGPPQTFTDFRSYSAVASYNASLFTFLGIRS